MKEERKPKPYSGVLVGVKEYLRKPKFETANGYIALIPLRPQISPTSAPVPTSITPKKTIVTLTRTFTVSKVKTSTKVSIVTLPPKISVKTVTETITLLKTQTITETLVKVRTLIVTTTYTTSTPTEMNKTTLIMSIVVLAIGVIISIIICKSR